MKNYIFKILTIALATLGFNACFFTQPKNTTQAEDQKEVCISDTLAKLIAFDTVRTEKIQDILKLSGEVNFDQDKVVRVMPLTSGVVLEVKVGLGDYVQAGQTLATMKSTEIIGANNDISAARADVAIAERNMSSAKSLLDGGLGSERDYTVAKSEYEKALTNLEKAQQIHSVYGATQTGGIVSIKAPASGYIVEKKVASGQQVRPDNADNLFTISGLSDVWVLVNVFENDIARVHEGYEVDVTTLAYPDKVFRGKIDKLSQMLDPDSKVMKARVRLDNSAGLLKPEMFTNVSVKNTEGVLAICIPSAALLMDFGKNYVVVYKDKCHYDIHEVKILKTVGDKTYLQEGVKVGETIVTKQQLLLFNQLKES